ncbi:hypothetical protein CBR_g75840, partial [Chara braunii]
MAYVSSPGVVSSQMTSSPRHVAGAAFDPSENWCNHYRTIGLASTCSSPWLSRSSSRSSPSPKGRHESGSQQRHSRYPPSPSPSPPPSPSPYPYPSPSPSPSPSLCRQSSLSSNWSNSTSSSLPMRRGGCAVVVDLTWGSRSDVAVRVGSIHPPPRTWDPDRRCNIGLIQKGYRSPRGSGQGGPAGTWGASAGDDVAAAALRQNSHHGGKMGKEEEGGGGGGGGGGSTVEAGKRVLSSSAGRSITGGIRGSLGVGVTMDDERQTGLGRRSGSRDGMVETVRSEERDTKRMVAEEEEEEEEEEEMKSLYQSFLDYSMKAMSARMELWRFPFE